VKLFDDLGKLDSHMDASLKPLARDAQSLDRYYIPTRYPNGLPDITPAQAYGEPDAQSAIASAQRILELCEKHVGGGE
jgi:HEPN domain-containing protein